MNLSRFALSTVQSYRDIIRRSYFVDIFVRTAATMHELGMFDSNFYRIISQLGWCTKLNVWK